MMIDNWASVKDEKQIEWGYQYLIRNGLAEAVSCSDEIKQQIISDFIDKKGNEYNVIKMKSGWRQFKRGKIYKVEINKEAKQKLQSLSKKLGITQKDCLNKLLLNESLSIKTIKKHEYEIKNLKEENAELEKLLEESTT